jgi:hypothetical protein
VGEIPLQFDEFWARAVAFLKDKVDAAKVETEKKLIIASWTGGKSFTDEKFAVQDASQDKITCLTIHAGKPIDISRSDMEILYGMWDDFVQGRTARIEIVEKVPRTTYALSLMKYLKDNIG